jgi:taurine--2-oxoglutarate transaminase
MASNTAVGARGMEITFADGSAFEDWCGQYFVNTIGAGRNEVVRALAAQARRLSWISPSVFADVRLDLARDLRSVLPRHLGTAQFNSGGSDSMESAVRAARLLTGRTRVLTLTRAYHGDTMTVENLCGFAPTPYADPRPWAVHSPSPCDLWEAAGRDWARAGAMSLERMERTLARHGARTFAAMVVEPVSWPPGAVPLPPGMARGLRALCDRHGIRLIADEVVTGFGRTGRWIGSQAVGLRPDAIVCAKGLTSGYAPLGAVVFERGWGEHLRRGGFDHGLTYGAHPLGCAAARATIAILRREGLVRRAAAMGGRLRAGLEALRAAHPDRIADVRGAGLLLGVQMETGRGPAGRRRAGARAAAVIAAAGRAGIHLLPSDDGGGFIIAPPFIVTPRRIDRLLAVIDDAVARP